MIYLNCPQCKSELEVDDGFAGGVCRCFNCGTLMTVPEDPKQDRAERLSRPESPGAARPDKPLAAGTYETTSGKRIQLNETQVSRVKVAAKRRVWLRYTVVGSVLGVALMLIVAVVFAISVMVQGEPEPDPFAHAEPIRVQTNPFLPTTATFMGLDVAGPTVFLADASQSMRNHLDMVKVAMIESLKQLKEPTRIQFIFAVPGDVVAVPAKPIRAGKAKPDALKAKIEPIRAMGVPTLAPAFRRAINAEPEQITFLAQQLPDEKVMRNIARQVKDAGIKLNVVLIGNTSPLASEVAGMTGGRYVEIQRTQLEQWYNQYLDTLYE